MQRFRMVLAAACLALLGNTAGADTVHKIDGSAINGQVETVARDGVTITQNNRPIKVPTNEIRAVRYDNEPPAMRTARDFVNDARFEEALASLATVPSANLVRPEMRVEYDYLRAYSAARIALTGGGDIREAGTQMATFINQNPTSYRYLDACRLVGDLLVASGAYDTAQTYYQRLAEAPWADYRLRAHVALGRAQLGAGDVATARRSFQQALDASENDPLSQREKLAASLGLARCLFAEQKPEEAALLAQETLARVANDDVALLAEGYNTLGLALREAKPRDAILAFLHVDLLYFGSRAEHIEALRNLHQLWNQIQMPERAAEAAATLRERYRVAVP